MRSPRPATAAAVASAAAVLLVSLGSWLAAQAPPAGQQPAPQQPAAAPPPAPAPQPVAAPQPPAQQAAAVQAAARTAPSDAIGSLVGANVTVYLRADAVGTHYNGIQSELKNLIVRRGNFVRSDDHWFILKSEAQETWIPQTSIALVEMRS
jgi:hypothetical protein